MKKIIYLVLIFCSCENKYLKDSENKEVDKKEDIQKKDNFINIDEKKYKISGEINLNL